MGTLYGLQTQIKRVFHYKMLDVAKIKINPPWTNNFLTCFFFLEGKKYGSRVGNREAGLEAGPAPGETDTTPIAVPDRRNR